MGGTRTRKQLRTHNPHPRQLEPRSPARREERGEEGWKKGDGLSFFRSDSPLKKLHSKSTSAEHHVGRAQREDGELHQLPHARDAQRHANAGGEVPRV